MSLNTPQGENLPVYAALSTIRQEPGQDEINNGVIPLDTLPAAWWNWLWNAITTAQNDSRYNEDILFQEINSVIAAGGLTPGASPTHDQLAQAIHVIKTTIATTAEAGSVVSTDGGTNGSIKVAADGKMTVNNFGDIANFHGAAKGNLMDALNETYDLAYNSDDEIGDVTGLQTTANDTLVEAINEVKANADSRAIKMHKSTSTAYGVGNATEYGHVKLSDVISGNGAANGVAATPKMVQGVITDTINTLNSFKFDYVIHDQASFEDILCRDMTRDPLVPSIPGDVITILIRPGFYVLDLDKHDNSIMWEGRIGIYGDMAARPTITFASSTSTDVNIPQIRCNNITDIFLYNLTIHILGRYDKDNSIPSSFACYMVRDARSIFIYNSRICVMTIPYRKNTAWVIMRPGMCFVTHFYDSYMTGFPFAQEYYAAYNLYMEFYDNENSVMSIEAGSAFITGGPTYILIDDSESSRDLRVDSVIAMYPVSKSIPHLYNQYIKYNITNSSLSFVSTAPTKYCDDGITQAGNTYATGNNRNTGGDGHPAGFIIVIPEYVYALPSNIPYTSSERITPSVTEQINNSHIARFYNKRVKGVYAYYDWETKQFSNQHGNDVFNMADATIPSVAAYNDAATDDDKVIRCIWVELEDIT